MVYKALHCSRLSRPRSSYSFPLLLLVLSCFMFAPTKSDTPANCTYEDIRGTWLFSVGPGNKERHIQCSNFTGPVKIEVKITLIYPDVAHDEYNNEGFWTLIYNQGFEVVIAGRKYFAFSKFNGSTSYCDQTMPGWSHTVLGTDWACYSGKKISDVATPKPSISREDTSLKSEHVVNSPHLIALINKLQSSWKAVHYPQFDHLTREELILMAGGTMTRFTRPKPTVITKEQRAIMDALPAHFDWRNLDGVNYVSPVRNQGTCGSCYAFASMAMNEARVRILTNNTQTPVFSTQDIVECSEYSQGCDGGFPYLVGGKYAEDYGLVEEECNPYKGKDGKCSTNTTCVRHYSTNYRYVGGYYGACNEPAMMQAIYARGPIAVSFEVYADLVQYHSGIYHHVFHKPLLGFDPFHITNHVVLIVGWGVDESSKQKYWIVKNSWGEEWGLSGYFWIRRGNDECGIESIAAESTPIYTYDRD